MARSIGRVSLSLDRRAWVGTGRENPPATAAATRTGSNRLLRSLHRRPWKDTGATARREGAVVGPVDVRSWACRQFAKRPDGTERRPLHRRTNRKMMAAGPFGIGLQVARGVKPLRRRRPDRLPQPWPLCPRMGRKGTKCRGFGSRPSMNVMTSSGGEQGSQACSTPSAARENEQQAAGELWRGI